jgi:hypothetical protein
MKLSSSFYSCNVCVASSTITIEVTSRPSANMPVLVIISLAKLKGLKGWSARSNICLSLNLCRTMSSNTSKTFSY